MSPETAFEELCSQICRSTPPAGALQFLRNATPDGGIEFYWILKSKKIVGWQCKFFQGPLNAGHWNQLDKSFKDALDNYPELTEYIVAMPQDLPQGRDKNKTSFRQRWEERVRNWTALAKKKKRQIKIDYVGDSEIFHFLDTQDQAGRRWYWFQQTALTQKWFEKRLDEAIANAGARYTPELNVDVPLRKTIEFLGRTEFFRSLILTHRGKVRKRSRHILGSSSSKFIRKADLDKLSRRMTKLDSVLTTAAYRELLSIDWQNVRAECGEIITLLRAIATVVLAKKEKQPIPRAQSPNPSDLMGMLLHEIDACISAIYDLIHEFDSVSANVSERKSLLITGEAGSGKTHLLCDIASDRIKKELPTVLLYGEHFQDQEPWNQICRQLQLKDIGCDELLQALESAGQAKQERALIVIDGLNEGIGRSLWRKYLRGMLATLSNYKWVALAISVRRGFESYLIDTGTVEELDLVVQNHFGFADVEFDAIPHFCKHYGLNMPSIPVLVPEFQNPLFLKLTCEGLRAAKRRNLPMGISGIKTTFDAFLAAINDKLAKKLELDPKDLLVQKSVEKLSEVMAKNKSSTLPYADAKQIVNQLSSASKFENSLFRHLISEGVLAETARYVKQKREDHIRFAYERFSDHLIVSHLLDGISSATKLKTAFARKGAFGSMCADPFANRGLLEALGIQIPERFGLELHALFPKSSDETALAQIVLSGLIWREPKNLGKECINFLLNYADRDGTFRDLFMDSLIALSPIPDHPLNARFLDRILSRQKLPIRDYIWSTFVSDYATYGRGTAVGRIVAWMNEHDSSALSPASASLYASVLTWMLSTPNRIVRDKATKALVRLLQSRTELLTATVKKYADVDDPYIIERLYGVAYGCALRTSDPDQLESLAKYVFNKQFHSGHPQNNILLRDYARGIIEIAARGKKIPKEWIEKSTPPYKAPTLPAMPSQKSVDKYKTDKFNEYKTTYSNVYYSVMSDNDFARDVLRSNLSRWLSRDSRDARAKQKNADRWNRIGQMDWRAPLRWILQRVFDLGWTEELFGSFDHAQHRRGRLGRDDNRFEGIDKKYTWIALYEMLSYLQDATDFNDEDHDELNTAYRGAWQLSYIRNIDPSRLEPIGDPPSHTASFPKPPQYVDWTRPTSDADWIKQRTDLPNPLQILGSDKWLLLNGAFDWEQPTEPGEDKYDIPRRSFWLEAQSCLVAAVDVDAVCDWLLKHDILNEALPKAPHSHRIFQGEFFRTLAFQFENEAYYCRNGWTTSYSNRIPAPILITVDGYLNESGIYDCSFENNVNLRLPCEYLVDGMKLRWNGEAGFIDKGGNLIAVDPAYWGLGPCQLLVSRDKLLSFLKSKKLDLVWLVRGQKRILGERWGRDAFAGQLNIQAVCRINQGTIVGKVKHLLVDQNRKQIVLRSQALPST